MITFQHAKQLLRTPIGPQVGGYEGVVVPCCDSIGIKVLTRTGFDRPRIDPRLGERRRRSVHGFFQELLLDGALSYGDVGSRLSFLTLSDAHVGRGESIGVFRYIDGKTIKKPSLSLFNAARALGAMIDTYGVDNCITERRNSSHTVVLETVPWICVEGLKQLDALREMRHERYARALYFFTSSLALHAVSPYPTTPLSCMKDLFFWSNAHQRHQMNLTLNDPDILAEIDRARGLFGQQFEPVPFDCKHFSNFTNFGLSAGLVADIQELRARLAPAVRRISEGVAASESGESAGQ